MWHDISITPVDALAVVVATAGMYWAFVILVRLLGQRTLARMSSSDLATAIALGAVVGRSALGYTPTLGAGIVALVTLFAMQALAGQLQRLPSAARVLASRPVVLMAGSEVVHDNLAQAHLLEQELWAKLRLAGVRSKTEVACVILESTGDISVLRVGEAIDQHLLRGVRGSELVPPYLVSG